MRFFWLALPLTYAAPLPTAPVPAALELHLDGVHLARLSSDPPTLLVSCEAHWVNATGGSLPAATSFGSVFDGLSLVGVDGAGREVLRQAYIYHQSPYAEDRAMVLGVGPTHQSIVFLLDGKDYGMVARYRLEGGLVGNAAVGTFASQWRVLDVFQ